MDFFNFELLFLGVPVTLAMALLAGWGRKLRSTFRAGKTIHELMLCTIFVWGTIGIVVNIVQMHNLRKMKQQEAACKAHKTECLPWLMDKPNTPALKADQRPRDTDV